MNSMRFERESDFKKEIEIITPFSKWCNTTFTKLGKNEVDFSLKREGKIVAYAEVKDYSIESTKYPTQIISVFF